MIMKHLKNIFYLLALLWALATVFKWLSVGQSLIYLGGISLYLSLLNILKLYLYFYGDDKSIQVIFKEKFDKGLSAIQIYALMSIGGYALLGLILIYFGLLEV